MLRRTGKQRAIGPNTAYDENDVTPSAPGENNTKNQCDYGRNNAAACLCVFRHPVPSKLKGASALTQKSASR
jgi:hypothetical protein